MMIFQERVIIFVLLLLSYLLLGCQGTAIPPSKKPSVPTLKLSESTSSPSNLEKPEIVVSGLSRGYTAHLYYSLASDDKACEGTPAGTGDAFIIVTPALPKDGKYKLYAKAVHKAKPASECSEPLKYELDTTGPTVEVRLANGKTEFTAGEGFNVIIEFNEELSDELKLTVTNGNAGDIDSTKAPIYTVGITPAANSVVIAVDLAEVSDKLGNFGKGTKRFSFNAKDATLARFGTLSWSGGYTGSNLSVPNTRAEGSSPTVTPTVSDATWAYTSTTTSICSVASDGTITAISAGNCIIRATISKAGYTSKSINHAAVTIVKGTVTGANWSSYTSTNIASPGETVSLTATPSGFIPSGGTLIFASSDMSVCTVNSTTGVVTGVANGTCTITATYTKANYNDLTHDYPLAVGNTTPSLATIANKKYVTGTAVSLVLPQATGGDAPITYGLTGRPTNWAFTPGTRTLSATTSQNNAAFAAKTLTYTATDTDNETDSETFTVTVVSDTTPSTVTVADQTFTVGIAITNRILGATSGANDLGAYSLDGTLPNGLSFDDSTRTLSGTPTAATSSAASITYKVVDNNHDSAAVTHDLDTFTITVDKGSQTVTAANPYGMNPTVKAGGTLAIVTAPTGQGATTYKSTTTSKCTVDTNTGTVTGVAVGTDACTIQAKYAGNANYNVSTWTNIATDIDVTKGSQTLTAPSNPYGTSPEVEVGSMRAITTAPSSCQASVSYQSTTANLCTVDSSSGAVTGVAVGTACTIQAKCASNNNYNETVYVTIANNISVVASTKQAQTLTAPSNPYGSIPSVVVGATQTITNAPVAGQGATEYQSTTVSYCTVNTSGTIAGVAVGTDVCTIQARYVGNSTYQASPWVNIATDIDVTKGSQTFSWPSNPYGSSPTVGVGQTLAISNAPDSGTGKGATVYSVQTSSASICDVNSSTGMVTGNAVGSCTIEAKYAGNTNYNESGNPVAITTPISVVQAKAGAIAVGYDHSCAIVGGRLECWGDDTRGELGNGSATGDRMNPSVIKLSGYKTVGVGNNHSCALTTGGQVKCWGMQNNYRLGNGEYTTGDKTSPIDVKDGDSGAAILTGVAQLSVGREYGCVVMNLGAVKCWGRNVTGHTGFGNEAGGHNHWMTAVKGVNNTGTLTGVKQVSAGGFVWARSHTCAVKTDGSVLCWGSNSSGQLGVGSSGFKAACGNKGPCRGYPLAVTLASSAKATQVSVGGEHTCAVLTTGGVQCWGKNDKGQLGDGTTTNRNTPTTISNLSGVIQVATGNEHTCALLGTGAIKCWGSDESLQLGNGTSTTANQSSPSDVSDITNAVSIAAGKDYTCALLADDTLRCWGEGDNGRLGTGNTTDQAAPAVAPSLLTANKVALGYDLSCAMVNDGGVKCWGKNDNGRLGDNSTTTRNSPVSVKTSANGNPTLSGALSVSSYDNHVCVLTKTGGVKCWGYGDQGKLGAGNNNDAHTASDVSLGSDTAIQVSVGWSHTCAVLANGKVKCWGDGANGKLGVGNTTDYNTPQVVKVNASTDLSGVRQIGAGYFITCALLESTKVKCWGNNWNGALGNGNTTEKNYASDFVLSAHGAVSTSHLTGVVKIAVSTLTACALKDDGTVWCWGNGDTGGLGHGSNTTTNRGPVQVKNSDDTLLTDAVDVFSRWKQACVITKTGDVKCWGENNSGLLGTGNTNNINKASTVLSNLSNVISLGLGKEHTCALLASGDAKCWGKHADGRLGRGVAGSGDETSPPTTVVDLTP